MRAPPLDGADLQVGLFRDRADDAEADAGGFEGAGGGVELFGGDFEEVARGGFGEEDGRVVGGIIAAGDAGEVDGGAEVSGEEHF